MKLPFCPFIDLLNAECEFVIDCHLEGSLGNFALAVDDVLDVTGKVSLLLNDEPFIVAAGVYVADLAENDDKLLDRAIGVEFDFAEAAE